MRNHTKLTAAAAIVGATALLAAACGTTEDVVVEPAAPVVTEPATTPEAPATEPAATPEAPATGDCAAVTGTVDFRWWGGDARAALQLEAIDAFNALYPNITINPMPVAFDGYWAQLQVEAVAGNTPDVFTANEAWLAALFGAGVLADLSAEPNLDLSQYTTDMLGAAVAPNGHVYAIPTGGNARAVVVNYDILEQAGIDVPDDETWSWDDFLAIAQQVSDAGLTNAAGETIFGASDIGSQGTARVWANQTDGGMFDAAGNLTWTEPSMTDFLQLVT
ncbi:MAG: extracellular solute-binding protein, partial [Promicromonosporaceae bacterium]|nr:extracellular solute-binding protein [Promicromonosporaceae bacterium]